MIDAFVLSFRLRFTYRANGIIYALKSTPLLKRLLPSSLYASRGLKTFANVIGTIMEFNSFFLGKLLYLGLLYLFVCHFPFPFAVNGGEAFLQVLIPLTIFGGLYYVPLFDATNDQYYAVILLKMNAREYTLSNFIFYLGKTMLGFLPAALIFGILAGVFFPILFAVPYFVASVKICFTALSFACCKKTGKPLSKKLGVWFNLLLCAILVAVALLPVFLGVTMPTWLFVPITLVAVLLAVFAFRYLWKFDSYRSVYQKLLTVDALQKTQQTSGIAVVEKSMRNKIEVDKPFTTRKKGYAAFHQIFVHRHAKLLLKSAVIVTLVELACLLVVVAVCLLSQEAGLALNQMLMICLPYFLFLMYFLNRGKVITQAMFMNCDHSMLAYRFYRQPKAVLALFAERLKSIVAINLLPASVIAVGLPFLLFLTGGTDQPLNYVVLFGSIVAMSVFFSVHNLVLYYLLQPYNINLQMKSIPYQVISGLTYAVCYFLTFSDLELPTLYFGTAVTAFCVLYVCVALLLAYLLAPKTFRLRT